MRLDRNRPADRRLGNVYRFGAALTGGVLVVCGLFGAADQSTLLTSEGEVVSGISATEARGFLMVAFGSLLLGGAVVGGTFASTVNIVLGAVFVLSGLTALAVLDTPYNLLALRMPNVICVFVVGVVLLTFGMYGRFSGRLPYDNPYWRSRHPHAVPEPPRRQRPFFVGRG
ncbi:DUF4383 domain-containing protein [Thermobifida cellulosilytica]|uniref:DUF4383 domain-containing protein n=1 Tax=Thermobifida cellulosilytica TB100 TaxID=665004 RepID=A0A147KEQ3_THECS|nr:DUF4383 domain-containing protein [Thermobifida cellulosilytica]KUP95757.1 hypothetical protein AC529_15910 [Thermobifida cellulosilytica TB100]